MLELIPSGTDGYITAQYFTYTLTIEQGPSIDVYSTT